MQIKLLLVVPHPVYTNTDAVYSRCISGFPELPRVRNNIVVPRNQTSVVNQAIFPSMKMTCDGIITKWLFGSTFFPKSTNFNQYFLYIETWREGKYTSGLFHRITSSGINSSELRQIGRSDYEYELKLHTKVQANDIIGLRFSPISLEQPHSFYQSVEYQDYGRDRAPASYSRSNASDMFSITSSQVLKDTQFLPLLNPIFETTNGK